MLDAKANNPNSLILLTVHHLTQKKIVIVFDPQQRAGRERLVEVELGPTFTDVSNFTLKNLACCSKYAHDRGLTEGVALILSLIQLLVECARRIHGRSLRAHNAIFDVLGGNCDRSSALGGIGPPP